MDQVLAWVMLIECLSWSWWLLAWPLFERWPDRGIGLSKAAGPLLLALPAWLLSWAGVPALSREWGWGIVASVLVAALASLRAHRSDVRIFLRDRSVQWLSAEGVWIAVLAVFLLIRAAGPAIATGEKPMDFAFLNAGIRSTTLPLDDPWFAGAPANYYYFGYLSWALPAKLLATPAAVAYNLAVASVPAAVAAATWCIGLALTASSWLAFLSVLALVFFGTLAGVPQFWQIGAGFDVWSPTRVIPGTINEFPFFSFHWGDLHPHVMAMPNFLLSVGLALTLRETTASATRRKILLILFGTSLGIAASTSAWDVAPLTILLAALLLERWCSAGARVASLEAMVTATAALVVALPLFRTIDGNGLRVGLVDAQSPFVPFLLVHGLWLLPACLMIIVAALNERRTTMTAVMLAAAAAAGMLFRSTTVAVLMCLTIVAWRSFARWPGRDLWLIVATAVSLLLIAEIAFVDDVYERDRARLNSVFKLHLHACLLLGLAWSACARWLWQRHQGATSRAVLANALAVAVGLAAIYPIGAIASDVAMAKHLSLDDGERASEVQAGDRLLVEFLNREIAGRPVVAEATGASYSPAARVSARTGLPTIVGWVNHEALWRRGANATTEINERVQAVRRLYEGDAEAARRVIATYSVRYVVVGALERQTYLNADVAKFDAIGSKVFDRLDTRLYDVGGADSR